MVLRRAFLRVAFFRVVLRRAVFRRVAFLRVVFLRVAFFLVDFFFVARFFLAMINDLPVYTYRSELYLCEAKLLRANFYLYRTPFGSLLTENSAHAQDTE